MKNYIFLESALKIELNFFLILSCHFAAWCRKWNVMVDTAHDVYLCVFSFLPFFCSAAHSHAEQVKSNLRTAKSQLSSASSKVRHYWFKWAKDCKKIKSRFECISNVNNSKHTAMRKESWKVSIQTEEPQRMFTFMDTCLSLNEGHTQAKQPLLNLLILAVLKVFINKFLKF